MGGFGVIFTLNDPTPLVKFKAWFYERSDADTYAACYQNYGAQVVATEGPSAAGPLYREPAQPK